MRCRAARTRAAGLMPGLAPPDLLRVSLLRLVLRVTGVQLAHRDQGQTEVADPCQQPVQRGLIREQASDDRLPAIVADLEAAEPVCPPVIKDAVDADLVAGGLPRAVHAWSSPRLADMARQAPRRNHGNGEAPFTATGRVTGFPVQAGPFATRSSLRTAIAILRSVCLASPGTLRTAARSARHPKVPVRVESSDEGAGHDSAAQAPCSRANVQVARRGAGPVPGLAEQLTARELEILVLLAALMPNPRIAEQLMVTLDTVK